MYTFYRQCHVHYYAVPADSQTTTILPSHYTLTESSQLPHIIQIFLVFTFSFQAQSGSSPLTVRLVSHCARPVYWPRKKDSHGSESSLVTARILYISAQVAFCNQWPQSRSPLRARNHWPNVHQDHNHFLVQTRPFRTNEQPTTPRSLFIFRESSRVSPTTSPTHMPPPQTYSHQLPLQTKI